jgi:hypothetical protein
MADAPAMPLMGETGPAVVVVVGAAGGEVVGETAVPEVSVTASQLGGALTSKEAEGGGGDDDVDADTARRRAAMARAAKAARPRIELSEADMTALRDALATANPAAVMRRLGLHPFHRPFYVR